MPSAPAGARDASPHGAATPVLRTNARRGPSAGRLGTRLRGAVSSVRSAGAAPLLEVADRTAGEALAATAGFALAGARQAAEAPAQLPLAGAEAAGGLAKVPAG